MVLINFLRVYNIPEPKYLQTSVLGETKPHHKERGVYLFPETVRGKTFMRDVNEMKVITWHNRADQGQPAK